MAAHSDVLVFCETDRNGLAMISREALGCGRKLADELGVKVNAVLAGKDVGRLGADAISHGADKVFLADSELLQDYHTETYLTVFEKLCGELSPGVIVMGQTSNCRDFAPALAARLDTAVILDCLDVGVEGSSKQVLCTKPVYGGNAWAYYTTESTPQIVTIRAKAMQALERDDSRSGETVAVPVAVDPVALRTRLVEKITEPVDGERLEDARVVVGAGRGIGGPEALPELKELATSLKGVVGASRAVCDNSWLPTSRLVGLTGKVVTPELYFAIGISGASQHMAGCSGSSNIIAINNDDGANIFREANYGVLGDWKPVVKGFIEKLTELNS